MKYMGSKNRISKHILPIILRNRKKDQYYVEPFVGGANLIDKVDGLKIGADNNKYLIAMWKKIQEGWLPPEFITKEYYSECRKKYNDSSAKENEYHIIGYVGFSGSYGGRFYDGGYAGKISTKAGKERNYPKEAFNNIMKQKEKIKDVKFEYASYENLFIPPNSIIYCDIPYKDTKEYKSAKNFNHAHFWAWAIQKNKQGHEVYVTEYQAPSDFKEVWRKEVISCLKLSNVEKKKTSVEKLYVYEG